MATQAEVVPILGKPSEGVYGWHPDVVCNGYWAGNGWCFNNGSRVPFQSTYLRHALRGSGEFSQQPFPELQRKTCEAPSFRFAEPTTLIATDTAALLIAEVDYKQPITVASSVAGSAEEKVVLHTPGNPGGRGNIEEWLRNLESERQRRMRRESRVAATGVGSCHWNALLTEAGKIAKLNNDTLFRDMWNPELHKLSDLVGDTANIAEVSTQLSEVWRSWAFMENLLVPLDEEN